MKTYLLPFLTVSWKTSKLYDKYLNAAALEYGLTRNEKDVLLFLHNNAPLNTAGDIVKYRAISKSLVAKSVASLTKRRFLEQTPDSADARFVHLTVTSSAMPAVRLLKEAQDSFYQVLEGSVSQEEWRIFADILLRIGAHIENK